MGLGANVASGNASQTNCSFVNQLRCSKVRFKSCDFSNVIGAKRTLSMAGIGSSARLRSTSD